MCWLDEGAGAGTSAGMGMGMGMGTGTGMGAGAGAGAGVQMGLWSSGCIRGLDAPEPLDDDVLPEPPVAVLRVCEVPARLRR